MSLPLPVSPTGAIASELEGLRRVWWLLFLLGLASVVLRFLAISSTFVATWLPWFLRRC
jgi:hypothetical protein